MGEYTVKARFQADIKAWTAGLKDAANATDDFARATEQAAARATKAQQSSGKATRAAAKEQRESARAAAKAQREGALALQQTADVAAKAAIAVGAGMGLAAKAAIDWESAWAGVTKSVDGATPKMEAALRGLAKTMPATHDEIAAVAEAAGQLGVASGDIVGFTETMIQLGETTNLTADEAATSIAQISNVMGTMDRLGTDGVNRFAAALVELGNNGASTERDILSMASRIAGAAKVVGMTESDLLALSNALSSVGVEAEAGGTAMSNVLMDMSKAVKAGGDELDAFAQVAGVSADQFAQAFETRPAQAMDMFVQGLGRISESGGDVFSTLDDLGMADVRVASSMLKMAGAGDLLTQSLRDGEQAWSASSALQNEFAKRAETTAAKMQIARNNIRDAAISIGDSLLPVLSSMASGASRAAEAVASIPAPIRNTGLAVAGLGSAGILAAAGVAKVVDVAKTAGEAFTYISTRAPRAGAAMTRAGKAAAIAGKAFLGLTVAGAAVAAFADDAQKLGSEQLIRGLDESSDAVAAINAELQRVQSGDIGMFNAGVHDLGDALRYAFDPSVGSKADNVLGSIFGAFGADNVSDINEATARLADLDAIMADLVGRGNADKAAAMMSAIGDEAARQGVSVEQLAAKFPAYQEALAGAANAAKDAGQNSAGAAGGVDSLGDSAEDAAAAVEDLQSSIEDLGSTLLAQRDSARGYEAALDDAAAAAKENGRTLNISTEAGRANQEALDGIAEATKRWAADSLAAGASASEVAGIIRDGRAAYIEQATAMGMSGAEAAKLADKLGLIPEHVRSDFEAAGLDDARTRTEGYIEVINGVPTLSSTRFETPGSTESQGQAATTKRMLDEIPKSSVTHFSTPGSKDAQWQSGLVKDGIVAIPKSWSSHLSVSGAAAASAAAWQVKNSLESIPRTVWSSVIVSKISRNIPVNADGGIWQDGIQTFEKGGIALATGAYVPRVSQIASGTGGILWQEPETGWETYISGKPSQRRRNLGIWAETGRRLGIDEELLRAARVRHAFADGGGVRMPPNVSGSVAPTDPSAFGAAVGAHVQAALHGAQVVMDGARVGRLVTRHQSGMTRV